MAAAGVAMLELIGVVAMPAALTVIIVPAAALMPVGWSHGRRVGTVVTVVSGALAVVLGVLAVFSPEQPGWTGLWSLSWGVPVAIALVIALGDAMRVLLRARRAARPGHSVPELIVDSTSLGHRALRVAAEEERDRAAQMIHRDVLPRVATSIALLRDGDSDRSARILDSLATDLRDGLDQSQLAVLRAGGVGAALQSAAAAMRARGMPCAVTLGTGDGRPPWDVELAAWRIAQEALSNAALHASARCIEVAADVNRGRLELDVIDDGIGLQPPTLDEGRAHTGIPEMVAWAHDVGGRVELLASEPSGVDVRFRWAA